MQTSPATLRRSLSALILCLVASWSTLGHAEQEFPGALQEAADMECVPTCLMCHDVNPGTASTYNKPLAGALLSTGKFKRGAGDAEGLKEAWNSYASNPMNAANVALIKQGIEPRDKVDVCGPVYGCGATFARQRAGSAPAAVAGIFVLISMLWLARRRR
jgi:hypothetical protein